MTLTIVNLPPVANNDTATLSEDGPAATGNVITDALTGDADTAPDSDPLTVTAINGDPSLVGAPVAGSTGGTFTLNPDGSWTFDPGQDFQNLTPGATRETVISYRVSDGQGGTAEATITVTVTGANDAPVALGPITAETGVEGTPIAPIATAPAFENPTNISLTFSATNLPEGLTIDPVTGIISGTPANDASEQGPYVVLVTAVGPNGETATIPVQIAITNPAPVAVADNAATPADTPVVLAPLVNDTDADGDVLTVTAVTPAANGTATLNPNGTITYVPAPGFVGTETLTYAITDAQGQPSLATITIVVGAPPADAPVVAGTVPAQTGTDDQPITPIDAAGLFTDPDSQPLTFTATGLPPGLAIDPVTGIITGTLEPDASVSGPYPITVTGVDPDGNQVSTTFVLGVLNPAPVAADDTAETPMNLPVVIGAMGNDSDPDGDALQVTYASDPANGSVTINPDGTLTYSPDANFAGTDTFSYTVSDGEGGTSVATVTVYVGVPNPDAPVVTGQLTALGVDGSPISPINIGATITHPNGDPLAFSATGLPEGLAIDPVTGIITGTLEPGASTDGPFPILVTAVDPAGNQVTTTVVLTAANPLPAAGDDTAGTAVDQPVTVGVLANDHDSDGDVITVTAATDPVNGAVVINPNGTITYTPDAGFTGTDTFTYTITDADGTTTTATVTVNVGTPSPLAASPAIAPITGTDGQPITPVVVGPAFGDPDALDTITLSVDPAMLPPGLVFDPLTGTFSGTPANTASQGATPGEPAGTYIVPVVATDANGLTTTTYVTFSFTNLPPVAMDDVGTVFEDTTITGNVITDALTADADTAPDSDPLTVTAYSVAGLPGPIAAGTPVLIPSIGTLVINSDGSYTFTPMLNYNGPVPLITYTLSDGNGGSDTATLTLTVSPVNDAPLLTAPSAVSGVQNTGLPADQLAIPGVTIADIDSATAPVRVTLNVAHGTLSLPPGSGVAMVLSDNGKTITLTGTPADINAALATLRYIGDFGFHGADALDITVDDIANGGAGGARTAIQTMAISVAEVALQNVSSIAGAPLSMLPDSIDVVTPTPGEIDVLYPNNTFIHYVVTDHAHYIDRQYGVGDGSVMIANTIATAADPSLDNAGLLATSRGTGIELWPNFAGSEDKEVPRANPQDDPGTATPPVRNGLLRPTDPLAVDVAALDDAALGLDSGTPAAIPFGRALQMRVTAFDRGARQWALDAA